ncbi:iron-chelator utilization protein [Pseudonocardia sp. Ae168_Ps1]|uniref:siderophore-interacting protein n=1 Tax=unclassified Pseudonocardia TaxID=2619320 RepID=UPI00095B12E5|nr:MULTISPECIES: siderophore-interacting protein [unclassified Pseudonocardia]OLL73492.1 iron-chelator utilization protein [Pseudonocardia sp. Ae150A_Ps1]OLL79470.1 iron-chelator utilization protein [Pseudonocardia sp. Ae168_Ps1]OLL86396.1 iron-chelator utilization protein [Pseudonocardia sp. Ae263_Ps1]OLL93563.1 iron-chelator utilization protein [Pseudonocardia sp. Ae356_Ps1]
MPKTSRPVTVHPLSVREARVARIVDLTPGMRRITLAGPQLGAFTSAGGFERPAFTSPGFDDSIRLIFPYPGETEPVLPIQGEGGVTFAPGRRPLAKAYSVRRWNPETGELDVDVVRHGVGVATTWAYRAAPGDRIHLGGPSSSKAMPVGAQQLLVVGDETALPAIARLLDELPENAQAQVIIEVAEQSHIQPLRRLPGVTLRWLVRAGTEAGTTGLLLAAVRELEWSPGRLFAWVAGEQAEVRDIRRHLVEERGMAKHDVEHTGYWRRTATVTLADDASVPDLDATTGAFEKFHELSELVPPIALRVAAGLGIGDLISRGVTGVADLAERSGSDERALGKPLRYLDTIDVLHQSSPGHYTLTEVGEFLTTEIWTDALDPHGTVGRQSLGLYGLGESVRTGGASYAAVTGHDFAALRRDQAYEDGFLETAARAVTWLAEPLAKATALTGVEHLVIHSVGAGALAREIVAAHPHMRITPCPPCPPRPTGCAATCPSRSRTTATAHGSTSPNSRSSSRPRPPTPSCSSTPSAPCRMPTRRMRCVARARGCCWWRTPSTSRRSTSTTPRPTCSH